MHPTNSSMNVNVTAVEFGLWWAITWNAFLFETLIHNLPWEALLTRLKIMQTYDAINTEQLLLLCCFFSLHKYFAVS